MRRNTLLRYVFLTHVRLCTLPSKSLARLVLLIYVYIRAIAKCYLTCVYIFFKKPKNIHTMYALND